MLGLFCCGQIDHVNLLFMSEHLLQMSETLLSNVRLYFTVFFKNYTVPQGSEIAIELRSQFSTQTYSTLPTHVQESIQPMDPA